MKLSTMQRIFRSTFAQIGKLTASKGKEYAEVNGDGDDRLRNFYKGGIDNEMDPRKYWKVLAGKHWTSINDYINRVSRGEPPIGSEDIFSRIDDMVLYLLLLKCLVHEREGRMLEIEPGRDPQNEIFEAIAKERLFQDGKYGSPHGPRGGRELAAWCLVIGKELREAEDACTHGGHQRPDGRNSIRSELVQVAAVCVAALEQHGLKESEPGYGTISIDHRSQQAKRELDAVSCVPGQSEPEYRKTMGFAPPDELHNMDVGYIAVETVKDFTPEPGRIYGGVKPEFVDSGMSRSDKFFAQAARTNQEAHNARQADTADIRDNDGFGAAKRDDGAKSAGRGHGINTDYGIRDYLDRN